MEENPHDKTESQPPAIEDKVSVPSEKKIGMSEHNGTHKQVNPAATFFKTWSTPLSILIATGTLLFSVYQFNAQQHSDSLKAFAQQQLAQQQEAVTAAQALDQQRQATLDGYLQNMSDLLLKEHLRTNSDAQALAQALTYTAVRNLDGTRKGTLVRFLWGAQLINAPNPILNVQGADLSGAVFAVPNEQVNLSGVSLVDDILEGANLSNSDLQKADLSGADLRCMNLGGKQVCANLTRADLSGAKLNNANLSKANLSMACLGSTATSSQVTSNSIPTASTACSGSSTFYCARFASNCPLSRSAPLSDTNLSGADLSGADLSGAVVNQSQLDEARTLTGATMPDGSKHP